VRREDLSDEQWNALSPAQRELYLKMRPLKLPRCKHCGSLELTNKGRRTRKRGPDKISYHCRRCGRSTLIAANPLF